MEHRYYSYISTLADWDPVKTVFLCPPAEECRTEICAQTFAEKSGWLEIAEQNKCLLIVPVAENGWQTVSSDHLCDLFGTIRNNVNCVTDKCIWGRGGTLMCWEVIAFGVGYGDGAEYLSRVQVENPSFLAAAALVDGGTEDFSRKDVISNHRLMPQIGQDYAVRNCEVPVHTWIYGKKPEKLVQYLNTVNRADACKVQIVDGLECEISYCTQKEVHQVRYLPGAFSYNEALARHIHSNCFNHVIRWKNGPDGTLAFVPSRREFYNNPANIRRLAGFHGNHYNYFIHLPAGKTVEECRGLPLVVSVHGRGEPVWMYSDKNGWESLADETGEFVTLSPDSPGNVWFRDRDAGVFPIMIEAALAEFSLDASRVYLTGFSNGGMMTREISLTYPSLFAACSPWNGPGLDTTAMPEKDTSRIPDCILPELQNAAETLVKDGWQMPVFMYYGDRDPGIGLNSNLTLPYYLKANGCQANVDADCPVGFAPDKIETYEGNEARRRFTTYEYHNPLGKAVVCVTLMQDMPHGAIREESRAAWEFMKQFKRESGCKTVFAMD